MKVKGMVMEINDHNVILLTRDGQFISHPISGLCPQIGDEISIEEKKRKGWWISFSFFAAAAAAVLITTLFSGKLWNDSYVPFVANGVTTYITVDINPSVELGLDEENTVNSVIPLNLEGGILIEKMALKGKPSEQAVADLIDQAAKEGYLAPEKQNQIIINVSGKSLNNAEDKKLSENISLTAEKTVAKQQLPVKINVINTDFDLREKAGELGISAGKYAVLIEAKDAGLNINAARIKESGLTKAIKDAGGDLEKIIKKAQDEKDFPEKIQKWQHELKEDKGLTRAEEQGNKAVLQEIKKLLRGKGEDREKNKDEISQPDQEINNSRNPVKDKKGSTDSGEDNNGNGINNKDKQSEEKNREERDQENKDRENEPKVNKDKENKAKENSDRENKDKERNKIKESGKEK